MRFLLLVLMLASGTACSRGFVYAEVVRWSATAWGDCEYVR